MLEEIYYNPTFPRYTATCHVSRVTRVSSHAPVLPVSLADSGKSRADLWSFAASVAVEWGVDRNNHGCEGNDTIGEVVSAVADSAVSWVSHFSHLKNLFQATPIPWNFFNF